MRAILFAVVCTLPLGFASSLPAQTAGGSAGMTPHWLWHAEGDPAAAAPAAERFFRKTLLFDRLRVVKVDITCDNEFVLYWNGQEVGRGDNWKRVYSFDLTDAAHPGTNVLAVRAKNWDGPAGLLVRGYVGWANGTQWTFHSDGSWRSHDAEVPGWNAVAFDDARWPAVKVLGALNQAGPWRGLVWDSGYSERFAVPDGFRVETAAAPELTGTLLAMTFDAKGRPTISRERGPAAILHDDDGDGRYDRATDFGPEVTESQGLYWIGRSLYASGKGPVGDGLYRITDDDGDDCSDRVEMLTHYRNGMGGHGPHGVALGPDGRLYHAVGNHAFIVEKEGPRSPIRQGWLHEGVLLPRYEDPRGHAAGMRVPGGTNWRLDRDGKNWELVNAGFRNQYDLAFNAVGELFTFDADMEWDVGLPWYRPVRVIHCTDGAEFGWRSGNAKWPAHYPDSLPGLRDFGRGSPTGVMVYQHPRYPARYRDTLWLGDWTNGLILVEHLRPGGATYRTEPEIFARGEPMNITDLEVGPDGNVYFATGGWGTEGGVYRIEWTSAPGVKAAEALAVPAGPPAKLLQLALEQPQPLAAWAVERVETIRKQVGQAWPALVAGAALASERPAAERIRAVDLLQIHGPPVTEAVALALATASESSVRQRIAPVLGELDTPKTRTALIGLLADADLLVRRRACEALARTTAPIDPEKLLPLLAHEDRFLRYAARQALLRCDPAGWQAKVLAARDSRTIVEGLLALQALVPGKQVEERLRSITKVIEAAPPKEEAHLSALRVAGVLLLESQEGRPASTARLQQALLQRFPTGVEHVDWEAARLLAFLDAPEATAKIVERLLEPSASRQAQIHYAVCLRHLAAGWTPELRRLHLAWFDGKHHWEGGFSFAMYLQNVLDDVAARTPAAERRGLIREFGVAQPFVTAALVRSLPPAELHPSCADLIALEQASRAARPADDDAAARQRLEDLVKLNDDIILALGRSGDARAKEHLRSLAAAQPQRRDQIARSLAQTPHAADWPVLVEALDSDDPATLRAVLAALEPMKVKPTDARSFAHLIRAGAKLGDAGGLLAVRLHNRWADTKLPVVRERRAEALDAQKAWFARSFPEYRIDTAPRQAKHAWKFDELVAYVTQNNRGRNGNVARGRKIFEQGQCIKCHRFEGQGNGIGPDLTTLSKRFKRADILAAIYYPSRDINDQYQSVVVELTDGTVLTGMQGPPENQQIVLLQSDGSVVKLPKGEIGEIKPSKVSIMPEGTLDVYALDEIADLLAFLESGVERSAVAGDAAGGSDASR